MLKRPELLAPVGELESFYAAIENGANAIYVGGKQFNARQFADNLDLHQLKEIVDYGKLRNIKSYVTLNILIKNKEMDDIVSYIHDLSEIGVDAVIIQDFGLAKIIREYFPSMMVHASTQMSVHSKFGVKFLKNMGFARVVLARELSLQEIKNIKKDINIEIESFVHGALCVSYSGQCLMSGIIGGRSGNRGRCAQPCRLPYTLTKEGMAITDHASPYLMSPKDIQTLELIPQLIESGIDTFKIEGRMKSPEYVASVIRIYDAYIEQALKDKKYQVNEQDEKELLTVFNRGGFTQGYYENKAGKAMMAVDSPKNTGLEIGEVIAYHEPTRDVTIKTSQKLNPGDGIGIWTQDKNHVGTGISTVIESGKTFTVKIQGNISKGDLVYLSKDHQLLNHLKNTYHKNKRKSLINITLTAKLDHCLQLELEHENGCRIKLQGDTVEVAKNAPLSPEKLVAQISKFGNTPFQVRQVDLNHDSNIYIPISKLNKLRREATKLLTQAILNANNYDGLGYSQYMANQVKTKQKTSYNQSFVASVRTIDQLKVCMAYIKTIYFELENQSIETIQEVINLCQANGCKLYIALPYIEREKDYDFYQAAIEIIETSQANGYLIRTYGQYEHLLGSNKEKIIDHTLNVMNDHSISHWESYGAKRVTLSLEMSADEIENIRGKCLEMVIYGHIPIMTSEQCLLGAYHQCVKGKSETSQLYRLIDREDKAYPIMTNCNSCRMQLLSSEPLVLNNKMSRIQRLPVQILRFIFTIESPQTVKDIIALYADETAQYQGEYTNGYFIKGVE